MLSNPSASQVRLGWLLPEQTFGSLLPSAPASVPSTSLLTTLLPPAQSASARPQLRSGHPLKFGGAEGVNKRACTKPAPQARGLAVRDADRYWPPSQGSPAHLAWWSWSKDKLFPNPPLSKGSGHRQVGSQPPPPSHPSSSSVFFQVLSKHPFGQRGWGAPDR